MSMNSQQPSDSLLDREIKEAMRAGVQQPTDDFTRELMSVIVEEEAVPVLISHSRPAGVRFSWTLIGLGVVFLIIALLIPSGSSIDPITTRASTMWTIGALALISLLALTQ